MLDVIIIGAGASGLFCAAKLKQSNTNLKIKILEKLPIAGKKLLATGNGRCNLTNQTISKRDYNDPLAYKLIKQFNQENVIETFKDLGMLVKLEQGRYYPFTNQAVTLQSTLVRFVEEDIVYNQEVIDIKQIGNHYSVMTKDKQYNAKYIVIATGGKAGLKKDDQKDVYKLVKSLKLPITEVSPGIVQLKVKEGMAGLKGVRCQATLTLLDTHHQKVISDTGEVQLTDVGLSGIPAMQLSRYIKHHQKMMVKCDFIPSMTKEALFDYFNYLKKQLSNQSLTLTLEGFLHQKLVNWFMKFYHFIDIQMNQLNHDELNKLISGLKETIFNVDEVFAFEFAQVSVGGVTLTEINSNLELKRYPHIYLTGEVLNIDGACGGFNLQWAWSSGASVAQTILEENKKA